MKFDLVSEPFIPCLLPDGTAMHFGLVDTLSRAHEIRLIHDDSPLVAYSLHRLLLAILHRNFGPASENGWRKLWEAGRFDGQALANYFGQFADRFDLFGDTRPFYQQAGFTAKRASGINRLGHEFARGNNYTLFDHSTDEAAIPLTPAVAARRLIAEQAYAIGGGKSELGNLRHGPLVAGATALPQGTTLFQTLMLNMVAYDGDPERARPLPAHNDCPAWENDTPPSKDRPKPRGYLDLLTWQSRTIRLLHKSGPDGTVVTGLYYAQGRELEAGTPEQAIAYRIDKTEGPRPIRFSERRAVWRDSSALFNSAVPEASQRPMVISFVEKLVSKGVLARSARFDIAISGLCTDKAKINFWRIERFPFPVAYAEDKDLVRDLGLALEAAEVAAAALRTAVRTFSGLMLSPAMKPDKDRVTAMAESLGVERDYWSRLDVPFRALMADLPGTDEHRDRLLAEWISGVVCREAWRAFEAGVDQADESARAFRAVEAGRGELRLRLSRINSPEEAINV